MAFEYGESYYGLRTFGSSVGDVKDASAALTATSSIANVSYQVLIPASASLTATASITCSAESFPLKRSDEFDYGTGLYGANQYGSEDLQTIVSATSSIANVAGVRVQFGSATVSAVASITSVAEKINLSSGTTTATSTITASAALAIVGSGAITSTSTISATCNRVQFASGIVSVTSGTATIGREKWEIISYTSDPDFWTQIAA